MTRDSSETGELANMVRIWTAAPTRTEHGRGARWQGPTPEDYYAEWTLVLCLKHARVYPDDDRQCIKVAGDRDRLPGEAFDHS